MRTSTVCTGYAFALRGSRFVKWAILVAMLVLGFLAMSIVNRVLSPHVFEENWFVSTSQSYRWVEDLTNCAQLAYLVCRIQCHFVGKFSTGIWWLGIWASGLGNSGSFVGRCLGVHVLS